MKLFKKLVAVVAMAAVCLSMTAPVSAKADTGCTHESLRKNRTYEYVESGRETFQYWCDVDRDGVLELVTDFCSYTVFFIYEGYICSKCNKEIINLGRVGMLKNHSDSKCTNPAVG